MTSLNFNSYLLKKIALDGSSSGVLAPNTFNKYQSVSSFDQATLDELKNIDISKLLQSDDSLDALDENASSDQIALAEMVKAFMELDGVQQAADTDGNGEISSEEALAFLQSAMAFDGDLTNLTMEDLDNVIQSLNIDLSDTLEKAIEESAQADETEDIQKLLNANSANNSGSVGGNYGVGGTGLSSSASRSSATKQKTTEDTVAELEQQIQEKEDEITNVEEEAEQQIQEQEDAKKEAMEKAGVSEEEYKAYKEQEQKIEDDITKTDKEIDTHNEKISQNEATISSNNNYISSIDSEISNNETALSAVSGDDEEADSKKASIQEKIDSLNSKKESIEAENKKLEDENAKEKEAIQEAEAKKQELETKKQELLSKTLDNSAGFGKGMSAEAAEKSKEQIAQFDTKITEIRNEKDQKVAEIRSEIQELNVQLQDAKQKEERDGFLKDNSFLANEDVLELAKKFEGKSQSEMREIMREAGYQFDDGAWCADFVSYIAGQTLGEENLADWYKNCNRAYCPDIMNKAQANGAFHGEDQAQAGDAVLFDWDGDGEADHIGYVVGFNEDGSVQTIEGNTSGDVSGSQVATKQRNKSTILGYATLT